VLRRALWNEIAGQSGSAGSVQAETATASQAQLRHGASRGKGSSTGAWQGRTRWAREEGARAAEIQSAVRRGGEGQAKMSAGVRGASWGKGRYSDAARTAVCLGWRGVRTRPQKWRV
jgi:hypothetical protein